MAKPEEPALRELKLRSIAIMVFFAVLAALILSTVVQRDKKINPRPTPTVTSTVTPTVTASQSPGPR